MLENIKNEIVIYNDDDNIRVEVIYGNETVWLPLMKIAELFNRDKSVISRHIKNIFEENELDNSVVANFATTATDGKTYQVDYYNLDMIISIGYRVNSKVAVKFRKWATKILKDYMIQGFALDDERFMQGKKGDQEYFKRLLERIKLIRTSERMFYQKITDIFAECSIDYDKTSEIARDFYATIQNKFHYAITKNTAAEIIYTRADSKKDNMGLTNWRKSPDGKILKSDVIIAKNFLDEKELKDLNSIVNIFLDIAENRAERQLPMKMVDWIERVNITLSTNDYDILSDKGTISHEQAKEKAEIEYDKFKVIQDKKYLSDFDKLVDDANLIADKKD
ncbi:MAG: virulence RhuM family protein [Bacilli bacterium]|nr:virulence RhuM family protein [Bacilli bacterium]MDD4795273.1 virulence RhuM family protein [Bacilli bacterium]